MLNLFLLAGQAYAQANPDFEVVHCNRNVDNEPEMKLRISHSYFEANLMWEIDQYTHTESGYEKTVPENELLAEFDDECKCPSVKYRTV